jgi:hypothetical protein
MLTASVINPLLLCIYLGLERWEEARALYRQNSLSDTDSTARAAIPLEVDEIIDVIFSPRWRGVAHNEEGPPRCFPQNVPLPQMVDILVDLWEAEGLDT